MLESPHLAKITRTVVTDEITKRLVSLILDEGLKPGDKLPSERVLMKRFDVGRSSLREAIKTLTALGAVEISVGEGMFVGRGDMSIVSKPLSWALLMGEGSTREVIDARRIVEVELAGMAAIQATDQEIAEMGACLAAMRADLDKGAEIYSRSDLELHMSVARAAHNRVLFHVLNTLRQILRVWIVDVISGYEDKFESYNEHVPIYEAIRRHDVPAARSAMAKHLESVGGRLLAVVITQQGRSSPSAPAASAAS